MWRYIESYLPIDGIIPKKENYKILLVDLIILK